ncbi:uncharacterized protein [Lolium perenne]|uniref:uncharacterized protein n=1 Tax=Lolium perenne TaxID=4522 RepID=UPI003A9A029B
MGTVMALSSHSFDADYFNDDATHSPKKFRRRFRMNEELFLKIVLVVREYDKYFMAKKDCTGIYKGHTGECSIILEAVADHELWIWHAFFGMVGTNNDINVLQRSPVSRLAEGQAPAVNSGASVTFRHCQIPCSHLV